MPKGRVASITTAESVMDCWSPDSLRTCDSMFTCGMNEKISKRRTIKIARNDEPDLLSQIDRSAELETMGRYAPADAGRRPQVQLGQGALL